MEWVRVQLLLIDEDQAFGSWLSERLMKSGFVTRVAGSAEQALRSGLAAKVAAVLVNLGNIGSASGRHVRPLRDGGMSQPLMVLSSQCQWQDRVDCLDAGADDYLTKPVRAEEVAARLRAIIRRTAGSTSDCIAYGEIEMDLKARMVRLEGEPLELTRNEFRMLRLFLLHPDRILTHRELRDRLYAEPSERSLNAIEVYIARLRNKIGKHRIRTIRGIGYKFGDPNPDTNMAEVAALTASATKQVDLGVWFPEI
jgi:two-component system, OmpR family, response regulator